MMSKWFILDMGKERGPMIIGELRGLVERGRIGRDTLVRHESEIDWTRAGDMISLFPLQERSVPVASPIPVAEPVQDYAAPLVKDAAEHRSGVRSGASMLNFSAAVFGIIGVMCIVLGAMMGSGATAGAGVAIIGQAFLSYVSASVLHVIADGGEQLQQQADLLARIARQLESAQAAR
jgi:hypothetical protein